MFRWRKSAFIYPTSSKTKLTILEPSEADGNAAFFQSRSWLPVVCHQISLSSSSLYAVPFP